MKEILEWNPKGDYSQLSIFLQKIYTTISNENMKTKKVPKRIIVEVEY